MKRLALLGAAALAVAACGGGGEEAVPEGATTAAGFVLTAAAFEPGGPIPPRFGCDGEDVSPALRWTGTPEGTVELALVLEDPDAPGGTFTHWLVYGLGSGATSLPEAVPREEEVGGPTPLRQGENDFGETGFGGPCPPEGEEHRYVFRLLALDAELALEPGADAGAFRAAAEGHVLAEARLSGTYERP